MSPVRHVPARRPASLTGPGERLPGTWRYSSRLALVLSGGGARAAYHVGVLAGLAERLPGLGFPILAGVSAGAINTVYLAAHPGPLSSALAGLRGEWGRLTPDQVYCLRPVRLARSATRWVWDSAWGRRRGPATVRGLFDAQPLREFLRQTVEFDRIETNIAAGRLRAVALSATSYTTGRSVTFVQGGADTPTWQRAQRVAVRARLGLDHVMASAAVPLLFPAVRMGDEFYGDGSVRQMAPLAPALHLGARAVLAIGLRPPGRVAPPDAHEGEYPSAAEVLGLLLTSVFLDALEADAERLERINHLLAAFPPGDAVPEGLRPVELLMIRPSRNLGSLAAGQEARLPAMVRSLIRGIGGSREEGAEFLGYLLFDPAYTSRLVELGYEDVATQWPTIEPFFARLEREASG